MENKELFDKAEKALNNAFEAVKASVKVVSEKTGEAAHITKLMIEKVSLEHRVNKKFAQLGSRVYDISVREGRAVSGNDPDIQKIVDETRKLDVELAQVEAEIESERKKKKTAV
ncbi:MAG: hypothetical protein HY714_05105 [Candidatus Omnitrophica bacterium]|nr:hypothetical protein [Candidatus Omnitrophota bacterium]